MWFFLCNQCSQQKNAVDCGLFVLLFTKWFMKNAPPRMRENEYERVSFSHPLLYNKSHIILLIYKLLYKSKTSGFMQRASLLWEPKKKTCRRWSWWWWRNTHNHWIDYWWWSWRTRSVICCFALVFAFYLLLELTTLIWCLVLFNFGFRKLKPWLGTYKLYNLHISLVYISS